MRSLLVAMFALAAWFGPMSASATQAQSPLVVSALSVWAMPVAPGTTLDPTDPHVLSLAGSVLSFTLVSPGDENFHYIPQDVDRYYTETIESLPGETGTIEEMAVPQYGQKSRAASIVDEGLQFDVIASTDGQFLYVLMALAAETSPSEMSILTEIVDQMFDPTRPEYLTDTMQLFQEEFEPGTSIGYEPLLTRLPQRAEIPAEYQLLGHEVFIS